MNFFSFILKNKFPKKETRDTLLRDKSTLLHVVLYALIGASLVLLYSILIRANNTLLVTVPAHGGTIVEGIIGAPRFINPVLAMTETDSALSKLVFAGLMKEEADGTIIPELAEDYTLSPDSRTYTFTLREKLMFHDKTPLTSADVAFTLSLLQNPLLHPESKEMWSGLSIKTPDERTIVLTLPAPDQSFLQKMTIGILSQKQWRDIPAEELALAPQNLAPLGAGAFSLSSRLTSDGVPDSLVLKRNRHYALGAPLLKKLVIRILSNQQALRQSLEDGSIDFTMNMIPQTISGSRLEKTHTLTSIPTESTVGIYRHEGSSALSYAPLLTLLNEYVDRSAILDTVENGYGIPYQTPLLETKGTPSLETTLATLSNLGYTVINGVLTKGGTPVVLGIATRNDARLVSTAHALVEQLASLGVIVEVKAFDSGTFQDELARASFSLVLTDKDHELPASYVEGIPLYKDAVFLVANDKANGIAPSALDSPSLRYATVGMWHERTEKIYRWLIKQ